jgi:hypothetical protein
MKSRVVSKMLSCIILACMAAFLTLNLTGCIPPSEIKKLQPTMGHWILDTDGNKTGCGAGGNQCAYIAIGCSQVEIPVSLAEKLIEWQDSAAQL